MKVYIIEYSKGDYDYYSSWLGEVFLTHAEAKKVVDKYNKKLMNKLDVNQVEFADRYWELCREYRQPCNEEIVKAKIAEEYNCDLQTAEFAISELALYDDHHPATIIELEVTITKKTFKTLKYETRRNQAKSNR